MIGTFVIAGKVKIVLVIEGDFFEGVPAIAEAVELEVLPACFQHLSSVVVKWSPCINGYHCVSILVDHLFQSFSVALPSKDHIGDFGSSLILCQIFVALSHFLSFVACVF